MFPYTVKYTESEYDFQNNNLLYKIHQQYQNTFEKPICSKCSKNRKQSKKTNFDLIICIDYIVHIVCILYIKIISESLKT